MSATALYVTKLTTVQTDTGFYMMKVAGVNDEKWYDAGTNDLSPGVYLLVDNAGFEARPADGVAAPGPTFTTAIPTPPTPSDPKGQWPDPPIADLERAGINTTIAAVRDFLTARDEEFVVE